jgi:hypothetical protein
MANYTFTIKDTATVYYKVTAEGTTKQEAFENAVELISAQSSIDETVAGDNIYAVGVEYDGMFDLPEYENKELN